jgi:hypothetical protein
VEYRGSDLHKDYASPVGPPRLDSDKTPCPRFRPEDWPQLTEALRAGVIGGVTDAFRGGFPKRVWVWINEVLYEARLDETTQQIARYHGFPLYDAESYPLPKNALKDVPRVSIPGV